MCYYLSYHNPNPWPVFIQRNDLNTGLFLRTLSGGGGGRKLVKLSGPDSHEALPWLAPSWEILSP